MLNKIILHTVEAYLQTAIDKDENTYQRDNLLNVLSKIKGYRIFHKFSKIEHKNLVELGKTEEMEYIKNIEVDFSVFSIHLLNIWIDEIEKKHRPTLNISDRKIKELLALLVKEKLSLKFRDKEAYDRVSEIIDTSKEASTLYFNYFKDEK